MLYQNIRKIAKQRGFSVRRIELRTGLTLGSIYNWDKKIPSVDKVAKVAKYLGVSIEELLKDE